MIDIKDIKNPCIGWTIGSGIIGRRIRKFSHELLQKILNETDFRAGLGVCEDKIIDLTDCEIPSHAFIYFPEENMIYESHFKRKYGNKKYRGVYCIEFDKWYKQSKEEKERVFVCEIKCSPEEKTLYKEKANSFLNQKYAIKDIYYFAEYIRFDKQMKTDVEGMICSEFVSAVFNPLIIEKFKLAQIEENQHYKIAPLHVMIYAILQGLEIIEL